MKSILYVIAAVLSLVFGSLPFAAVAAGAVPTHHVQAK